nr:CDP-glycerol glycerophosphotransferase family protein [Vibrio coralliirubri]
MPTLLSIIPKNKDIWLFSCWAGMKYSDNSMALFEYVYNNRKNIRPIWITKNPEVKNELVNKGFECYYYLEPKGIYSQVKSKFVFFTHNVGSDFARVFIPKSTIKFNLFHGLPVKKFRFDDVMTYSKFSNSIKSSSWYQYISNEDYKYIASLGNKCTNTLSSALGHKKSNFLELGFPRNDLLFGSKPKNKIVYMPTFRNQVGSELDLSDDLGIDLDLTNKYMKNSDFELIIKSHPANYFSQRTIDKVNLLSHIEITEADANSTLSDASFLISDYSGVVYDFSVLKRGILLYCPDYDHYSKTQRDSYISREQYETSKSYSSNWNEILEKISIQIKEDQLTQPNWVESIHKKRDNKSCQRICDYIYKNYYHE